MSFPRYAQYKDSGVEWLGAVPGHWEVVRLKQVIARIESGVSVNAIDTPAGDGEAGVLKTSCVYHGKFEPAENKAVVPEELDRLACPVVGGTLIVSRMNTPDLVGAAGMVRASHPNLFLPDRLWQVHFVDAVPAYVHYWSHSPAYRAQVEMACAGTSSSMQNLSQDCFRGFVLAAPPRGEQAGIAAFLDRETAKIDALVDAQQNLIALLKEKRQALVSHAVTKGLDPTAPMKDSGVEWLGEVPAHWDVAPLKFLTESIKAGPFGSALTKDMYVGAGYRVYGQEQVIPDDFTLGDYHIDPDRYAELAQYAVQPKDILISCVGTFGKIAIVPDDVQPGIINPRLIRLRAGNAVAPEYLAVLLRSSIVFEQFSQLSRGGTMDVINIGTLSAIALSTPPRAEQAEITAFLDSETTKLGELVAEAENAIALLQERRTALISAAVAGKIDIRGLAVEVPANEMEAA